MIRVMCDDPARCGDGSAERRKNLRRDSPAFLKLGMCDTPKSSVFLRLMLLDEFAHLVDGMNAVHVAFPLRHSPGKESMTSEHKAFHGGIVLNRSLDQKGQFKTWSLPGDPDDVASELLIELIQLSFTVCACRQGDGPIGVKMVDMGEGEKRMQRCVDRSGYAVLTKRAQRIIADQFILILLAAVKFLELLEAIQIEKGKPGLAD